MRARSHLVSFADGHFARRKQSFRNLAYESGFFDSVSVYDFDSLPETFRTAHGEYMKSNRRGFGFWIWKPIVILEALLGAENCDCVVYLDAGFTINPNGLERFQEYLDIARESRYKMLSFQNTHTEAHWTKQDCAQRLGVESSSRHMKTSQLGSGFLILQNTKSNLDLLREWSSVATERNYHYSNDAPSDLVNHSKFQEHRHDQSISSLLRKLRGTEITHYEVQAYKGSFEAISNQLPAWATRKKR